MPAINPRSFTGIFTQKSTPIDRESCVPWDLRNREKLGSLSLCPPVFHITRFWDSFQLVSTTTFANAWAIIKRYPSRCVLVVLDLFMSCLVTVAMLPILFPAGFVVWVNGKLKDLLGVDWWGFWERHKILQYAVFLLGIPPAVVIAVPYFFITLFYYSILSVALGITIALPRMLLSIPGWIDYNIMRTKLNDAAKSGVTCDEDLPFNLTVTAYKEVLSVYLDYEWHGYKSTLFDEMLDELLLSEWLFSEELLVGFITIQYSLFQNGMFNGRDLGGLSAKQYIEIKFLAANFKSFGISFDLIKQVYLDFGKRSNYQLHHVSLKFFLEYYKREYITKDNNELADDKDHNKSGDDKEDSVIAKMSTQQCINYVTELIALMDCSMAERANNRKIIFEWLHDDFLNISSVDDAILSMEQGRIHFDIAELYYKKEYSGMSLAYLQREESRLARRLKPVPNGNICYHVIVRHYIKLKLFHKKIPFEKISAIYNKQDQDYSRTICYCLLQCTDKINNNPPEDPEVKRTVSKENKFLNELIKWCSSPDVSDLIYSPVEMLCVISNWSYEDHIQNNFYCYLGTLVDYDAEQIRDVMLLFHRIKEGLTRFSRNSFNTIFMKQYSTTECSDIENVFLKKICTSPLLEKFYAVHKKCGSKQRSDSFSFDLLRELDDIDDIIGFIATQDLSEEEMHLAFHLFLVVVPEYRCCVYDYAYRYGCRDRGWYVIKDNKVKSWLGSVSEKLTRGLTVRKLEDVDLLIKDLRPMVLSYLWSDPQSKSNIVISSGAYDSKCTVGSRPLY